MGKNQAKKAFGRILAMLMCLAMLAPDVVQAVDLLSTQNESQYINFTEAELSDAIRANDCFYIGSTDMNISEKSQNKYLVKIGRGGEGHTAATVVVKMTDVTSALEENYTIEVYDGETKLEIPEDYKSIAQGMIDEQDSLQEFELPSAEEASQFINENGDVLRDQVDIMTGIASPEAEQPVEEDAPADAMLKSAQSVETLSSIYSDDPLAKGKAQYTGLPTDRQPVLSQSTFKEMYNDAGNSVARELYGYTLSMDFAEGEREKFLVITPKYSSKADGDMQLMISLQESSEGTTISSLSSAAIEIKDEDEADPIEVGFKESAITADGEYAIVEIVRTGSPNTMVCVNLYAENGTAIAGRDFSPIGIEVYFPMGVLSRTIQVPIRQYSTQERSFSLKLNMAAACVITEDTLAVDITPIDSEEASVALLAATSVPVETNTDLRRSSGAYFYGGAQWVGDEVVINTNVAKYNEQVGIYMPFANGTSYFYDGIRVDWRQERQSSWWISRGYTAISNASTKEVKYDTWTTTFDEKTRDVYSGQLYTSGMHIYGACTSNLGRTTHIRSVQPIKRQFDVTLLPAASLTFKGVPTGESAVYTAAMLDNRSDTNLLTKIAGDSVTVTAINVNNYARLAGLELTDKDGKLVRWEDPVRGAEDMFVKNTSNGNSIQFTLSPQLIQFLGERGDMTSRAGTVVGSLIGQIYIRPVFEKYEAKVTLTKDAKGTLTEVNPPADGTYYIGDVIQLTGNVSEGYKAQFEGIGYGYETKLNDSMAKQRGTKESDFNGTAIKLQNKYNEFWPVIAQIDYAIKVRVDKKLIDGGEFDTTKGLFIFSTRTENAADSYYEYTVVPAGVLRTSDYPIAAYPTNQEHVPTWQTVASNKVYGGIDFFHNATLNAERNIITLSLQTEESGYYSLAGAVFNTDINLSTGRESAKPSIPATSAIISTGGTTAVADFDGEFKLDAFRMAQGLYLRYMIINNGIQKIFEVQAPALDSKTELLPPSKNAAGSNQQAKVPTIVKDIGAATVPTNTNEGAWFNTVSVVQADTPMHQSHIVALNGSVTKFVTTVKDKVSYVVDGKSFIETVTGVDFIVLDGKTKSFKHKFVAEKGADELTWTATEAMLGSGEPGKYTYGDLIYLQMTTDKKILTTGVEEGTKNQTVYAPISTGYQFSAGTITTSTEFEFSLPMEGQGEVRTASGSKGYYNIPFIESFGTLFQTEHFSLTVEKLPNNSVRVRFGFQMALNGPISKKNIDTSESVVAGDAGGAADSFHGDDSMEDDNVDDDNFIYGTNPYEKAMMSKDGGGMRGMSDSTLTDNWKNAMEMGGMNGLLSQIVGRFTKNPQAAGRILSQAKNKITVMASQSGDFKSLVQSMASPQFVITLRVGGTFDFALRTREDGGMGKFVMLGLGIYGGVSVQFIKNFYTFAGPVPFFIGFNLDANALLDIRCLPLGKDKLLMDQSWGENALKFLDPTVTLYATAKASAGVGAARLGAFRVYIMGTIGFKYQPAVTRLYEDCPVPWGLLVKMAGGFQVDLLGMEFPFPATSYVKGWDETLTYHVGLYDYMAKKYKPTAAAASGEELAVLSATETGEEAQVQARLKERASHAQWVANSEVDLQGGYAPTASYTLQENGYNQPDSQIMNIGGGRMLMVFLGDSAAKADTEITSLLYSIYDGNAWSEPVAIQNDATGDYYPNLCDAGDSVMISWSSADPAKITSNSTRDALELKLDSARATEIYTVLFNKAAASLGEIDKLTDDAFFDADPIGVYDATTADRTVYYIKNSSTSENLIDYASPTGTEMGENYTVLCYMLYDGTENRWLFDKYFDNELDLEDHADMVQTYKGQRFLSTPVEGTNDPIIQDVVAAPGYNTLAVYAYTVDMGNTLETVEDKELFLQVYDFETHKTYKPIKITTDTVSQAMPQLVRQGSGADAKTYLFWLDNQTDIRYINVTDLVKNGIESDGTIKEGFYLDIQKVEMNLGEKDQGLAGYQAIVDEEDNLYVIWPRSVEDYDGDKTDEYGLRVKTLYQEIFATALIDGEIPEETMKQATVTEDTTPPNPIAGRANWSKPYRLTRSKAFNDAPVASVDDNGNLIIVHNQFQQMLDTAAAASFRVTDVKLMATTLEPVGTISVARLAPSTVVPQAGEVVEMTVQFTNNGLTSVHGFDATFYEYRDGARGKQIHAITSEERVITNTNSDIYTFNWTVPADFETVKISAVTQEKGYTNTEERRVDPFTKRAVYKIAIENLEQVGDEYMAAYSIENVGNATGGSNESMFIEFYGPYGNHETYGISEEAQLFGKQSVAGMKPGDKRAFTTALKIDEKVFDYCGFVSVGFQVFAEESDGAGGIEKNPTSDDFYDTLIKKAPTKIKVNGGESLSVYTNSSVALGTTYNVGAFMEKGDVKYEIANPEIVSIDGDTMTGLTSGSTTLKVHVQPYGVTKEIPINVNNVSAGGSTSATKKPVPVTAEGAPKFDDVQVGDWFYEAASIAAKLAIIKGTGGGKFSPQMKLTRGMFVTMLARYDGVDLTGYNTSSFTDVDKAEYYAQAVEWASKNGIVMGAGGQLFLPDLESSREQIVVMMHRYAKYKGIDVSAGEDTNILSYDDFDQLSAYAIAAIQWALAEGIIQGTSASTLGPRNQITRAETAQIILNFIRNREKSGA